jgi:hypothetical protein
MGDLRVQAVQRGGGRGRSFTIVWPDGAVHEAADRFLRGYEGSGTQRTYAYLLLDHLRWLEREALAPETVSLQDLRRYMAALGAAWRGPYGQPWRAGRRPFGQSALSAATSAASSVWCAPNVPGRSCMRLTMTLGLAWLAGCQARHDVQVHPVSQDRLRA